MSISHTPEVQAQLDSGRIHILPLVKFEIPGNVVGYYVGPRPFEYNGFTYKPNKLLKMDDLVETLNIDLGIRELTFSNIPVGSDAIDDLEALDYVNAPAIVSRLIVDPKGDFPNSIRGISETSFHEIAQVKYTEGAISEEGQFSLTVVVKLKTPGKTGRVSTLAVRSDVEQRFDNNPNDTFLSGVGTVSTIMREFGTKGG